MAQLSEEETQAFTTVFKQIDKDGNGFLTKKEVKENVLGKLGFFTARRELKVCVLYV